MLGAYSLEIGFCVVDAPTATETVDTIPENIPELISGTETYVEFWVQDTSVEPVGITGGSLDFAYSTELLDTEIGDVEYGQSFDLLRGGTVDDSAGLIDDLRAGTLSAGVGIDEYALFARVRFDIAGFGDVQMELQPGDMQFALHGVANIDWSDVQFTPAGPVEIAMRPGIALIAWHEYEDGPIVALYDVDPTITVSDPDVAWYRWQFQRGVTDVLVDPGRTHDGIVNSITLYGDGTETDDLGFVIENNVGLGKLLDRRKGTDLPSLGFLVSEGYVKSVSGKAGIAGANLDRFTGLGGWSLPPGANGEDIGIYTAGYLRSLVAWGDVDGDIVVAGDMKSLKITGGGLNGDLILTESDLGRASIKGGDLNGAIHVAGTVGSLSVSAQRNKATGEMVGGAVTANAVITIDGSDLRRDLSLKSLSTKNDFLGTLATAGGVRRLSVSRGDFGGLVDVTGNLSSFSVRGGRTGGGDLLAGARVRASLLKNLSVSGSLAGEEGDLVQIYAGSIGNVSVKGDVRNSRILAGADLGDDWAPDGTGDYADNFESGSISRFSVKGRVADSLIGAGLRALDLEEPTFHPNSWIKSLSAGDGFDSSRICAGELARMKVRGDFYNSTIQAGQLGRVQVSGYIHEDDTDGDKDEIRALAGEFYVRDESWRDWIDDGAEYGPHWFDEGEPDGVKAWIG